MHQIQKKEDLRLLDGQQVSVVGIFKKSLTSTQRRGAGTFIGQAHIEVLLQSQEKVIIGLGQRKPKDFEIFTDQKVKVIGTIDFDPAARQYEKHLIASEIYHEPIMAMPISGPSQLLGIQTIELITT